MGANAAGKKNEKKTSKGGGFALQAGILAGAGILSRIIGLLYRSPLYQILGDEGNGYYGTAYGIYAMIIMIATYSIPTAVSKLVAGKIALGEYKNARRIFNCIFVYVVAAGAVAALITYFGADWFVGDQPNAVLSLKILAPTVFISGFLAVFRGYLQAYNTMVPTSVSQIIEQLANAVVSILAAYLLAKPFLPESSEHAKYGSAGSAMGTGAGVLCGLIYILIAYAKRRKNIKAQIKSDEGNNTESYASLFKIILATVTPIVIASVVYNVLTPVDMKIFYKVMAAKGAAEIDTAKLYGIYSGQYTVLTNLPLAIAASVGIALIPSISAAYTKGDKDKSKNLMDQAIGLTMMVIIPCAVGMGVLAKPIIQLLFAGADPMAAKCMYLGFISIIFFSLSTVTNSILQGIGKVMAPVINASLALILHIISLILLLRFTSLGLYALVVGSIIYSLLICIFNAISLAKVQPGKTDVRRIYVVPAIASIFMGALTIVVYEGTRKLLHNYIIAMFAAVIIAVLFYAVAILKIGGYSEEELKALPKGNLIVKLAKKMHLIRRDYD
jgi:stage V sporulation protein B